jgi:hypothetical protein
LGVLTFAATCANAEVADKFGGSYFCQTEFAGGGQYNEKTKAWESATFKDKKGFVLSLKYMGSRLEKDVSGETKTIRNYDVMSSEVGSSSPDFCFDLNAPPEAKSYVDVYDNGRFNCSIPTFEELEVNLPELRFLSSYRVGFIGGDDDNKESPVMSGGRCTKIPR